MPAGGGARLRQRVFVACLLVQWMAALGGGGGGVVVVGVVVEAGPALPGGHAIFRAYPGRAARSATLYRPRGAARSPERQCAEAVCKLLTPRQCATAMRHDLAGSRPGAGLAQHQRLHGWHGRTAT